MSFVVSARKYRPRNFDELIGQNHIATTLKNAIKNDKLAHAFLFSGPRGVGKTTSARILAKVLNCQNLGKDFHACEECQACKSFADNASFNIFELDAASNNSVDHIRALNDQVRFQPQQGAYKIYIIDEVHMLSQAAFNAFLKTLEEPPPYAKFILATTEKHKIIPTILSRCQIFDFRRIQVKDIVEQLTTIAKKEKREFDEESLHLIAQKADGAMRDALSIYDKIVSSIEGKISYADVAENLNVLDHDYYFQIVDAAIKESLTDLMVIFDDIIKKGFEVEQFVLGLLEHLRQLLFVKDLQTAALMEVGDKLRKRYEAQAELASSSFLLTALSIMDKTDMSLLRSQNKRLSMEIALSKMAYMNRAVDKKKAEHDKDVKEPATTPAKTTSAPFKSKNQITIKKSVSLPPEVNLSEVKASIPKVSEKPADKIPSKKVEEKPSPKTPIKSKLGGKSLMTPSISVDIDDLVANIEKEEAKLKSLDNPFTEEHIKIILKKWHDNSKSKSFQSAINYCKVEAEGDTVYLKTPSEIYKDLLRQELGLIEDIRGQYPLKDIFVRIKVDISAFPDYKPPQKAKLLTTNEKYDLFRSKNPNFEVLVKEFKLKPNE